MRQWESHSAERSEQCVLTVITVPLAESDLRGHSFGGEGFHSGSAIVCNHDPESTAGSVLEWPTPGALQCTESSANTDIDLNPLHLLFSALDPDAGDCAWANQAIAHCADVLVFSFGTDPRSAVAQADLQEQNQRWIDIRPASFDSCFVDGDGAEIGGTFPDIRPNAPWHGTDT